MRRSAHTDGEIAFLLSEAEAGVPIEDICRSAQISFRTFYRWRKRLGGLNVPAVERLVSLEEENRRLRRQLLYFTTSVRGAARFGSASSRPIRLEAGRGDGDGGRDSMAGLALGRFSSVRSR